MCSPGLSRLTGALGSPTTSHSPTSGELPHPAPGGRPRRGSPRRGGQARAKEIAPDRVVTIGGGAHREQEFRAPRHQVRSRENRRGWLRHARRSRRADEKRSRRRVGVGRPGDQGPQRRKAGAWPPRPGGAGRQAIPHSTSQAASLAQAARELAMLYKDFATQEELDAQYNLTMKFPKAAASYEAFCGPESKRVRSELDHRLDVPFGPTLAEHVDIYPAGENAPVLIYVHGGFWCLRSSKESGFVARGPASEGVATVVMYYALCPRVTIDEIVRQTRAAVAWTYKNAASFGGDPARIHVAGHSAGGHLVAMLLATDWESEYGLPGNVIKGATAISGLYDLAPFPYTFLQPKLQLGYDQIYRNSPIIRLPDASAPLLVAHGDNETDEFKRQSEEYLDAWRTEGLDGEILILQGKNHYEVIDGFLDAESPLCSAILGQMGVQ